MHSRRFGDRDHLVVIERGEPVVASLLGYAGSAGIDGGWVQGLGSVKDSVLGFYDLPRRLYHKRSFHEEMELGNLTGNFGRAGEERILHAHATISGPELIAFTGHLFEAVCAITCEFRIHDFGGRVDRAEVPEVGLRLICPPAGAGKGGR